MKEYNRKTLIEALSSLRQYSPPDELWESIQNDLLSKGLSQMKSLNPLPEYEPPVSVWENIAAKIQTPNIRVLSLRKAFAAAATILLLLTAGLLWDKFQNSAEDYPITYSTVTAEAALAGHNWQEDEEAFGEYEALCKSRTYICSRPEFLELKSELDELSDARNSLVTAMGKYGESADIILQIKEIELERTDILKKLMVMLI